MIPKDLIYDKTINENRIAVYSYFFIRQGLDDTVGFSSNHLVKWCGYSIDYHKGRINEKINTIVNQLSENNYFNLEGHVSADILTIANLNQEKFCPDSQFALIYDDELDKIRNFKKHTKDVTRMSSSILLLVLSYLRVNMLRRQDKYIGNKSDKPEFCYRYYINIEKDIGISNRYISRAVKILSEMGILAYMELPRYKDENGNWHTEVTLFADKYRYKDNSKSLDNDYDYQQELQWGVDYIKEKKYASKKFYQNSE